LVGLLEGRKFDAIFSSDLERAVETARIVFGCSARIITDKRLRERNYGLLTGHPSAEAIAFDEPGKKFPEGESYKNVETRVKDFLQSLSRNYAGKQVAIVAHHAPQLALEVLLNGKTWEQAIKEDWRAKTTKEWKPGWEYELSIFKK
jgi:broad specificity phosphatase PhoE